MNLCLTPKTPLDAVPGAAVAEDIMTRSVVSISSTATVKEAAKLLTEKGLSGLPVVDETGLAIGVVTHTDIVAQENGDHVRPRNLRTFQKEACEGFIQKGSKQPGEPKLVRDIMTPTVFSVAPDTPTSVVVDAMLAFKIHRVFVTDGNEKLQGVISPLDVLRHMGKSDG
jgi:CBS domain-containing protein